MKNLAFIIAISLMLGIGSIANTASAQSVDCAGLSGAAFGLCIGAQASECDGSETDSKGCDKMELRFEEMTGTTPPWTLPDCPCGSAADFITLIEISGATDIVCSVFDKEPNDFLAIDTLTSPSLVFTALPPLNFTENFFCGTHNNILFDVDDDEAQSCVNNIVAAAANFGVICTGLLTR